MSILYIFLGAVMLVVLAFYVSCVNYLKNKQQILFDQFQSLDYELNLCRKIKAAKSTKIDPWRNSRPKATHLSLVRSKRDISDPMCPTNPLSPVHHSHSTTSCSSSSDSGSSCSSSDY